MLARRSSVPGRNASFIKCTSAPFTSLSMTLCRRLPSPRWLKDRARSLSPNRSGRSNILASSAAVSACPPLMAVDAADLASF